MSDINERILNTPLDENDAGAETVRDYLIALLAELWEQEEGFSGKRPFGNSGWAYDVYGPLIKASLIEGTLDPEGYVAELDTRAADRIIIAAIKSLGQPPTYDCCGGQLHTDCPTGRDPRTEKEN